MEFAEGLTEFAVCDLVVLDVDGVEDREALAAPGAVLHVVPGMGHVLTSLGLPEEVADLIRL